MIRKTDQGLEWLEFELLQDQSKLMHAVFTRHGGVSRGPFASLNVGGGTDDNPEDIACNRAKILHMFETKSCISGKQVHGKHIAVVSPGQVIGECDGLATRQQDATLMIKHADCQAALFYDPKNHAASAVHCGWRGSVQNIYKETVECMRKNFGSKPENLLVGISPSLGPEKAEFKHFQNELPETFWKFQVKPTYFDFWEISRSQLLEQGILSHHIEIASLCTFENPHDFFSYRRDKVTGRNATVIKLQ